MTTHAQQSSRGRTGAGERLYVFCIARASLRRPIASTVSGFSSATSISVDGLEVISSRLSDVEFAGSLADASQEWLAPRAQLHDHVVNCAMRCSPVLPMAVGTVFESQAQMRQFVCKHRRPMLRFLDDVAEKQEWCVQAMIDPDRLAAWTARRTAGDDGAPASYLQRKRMYEQARTQSRRLCLDLCDQLDHAITHGAAMTKRRLDGGYSNEGRPIFRCAFLLHCDAVEAFRHRLGRAQQEYADAGVALDFTGPWPPYSFCPVFTQA